ncbi:hypothetical protein BDA96_01G212500 [Sorghum bicolor]|uniref:FAD/NAD(P)-binding domain-containing protein n=1 Tax=Sorghum bicolor TaxID=4558 RepID=A0A921S0E5_SORBI|nr:hypothetical protein BDA96_01G212500 [Sorghum bicolor]
MGGRPRMAAAVSEREGKDEGSCGGVQGRVEGACKSGGDAVAAGLRWVGHPPRRLERLLPRRCGARLPAFHTCVGANDQLLTADWYKEHGIELILRMNVISVDVRRKTLDTSTGETMSYGTFIAATGARVC